MIAATTVITASTAAAVSARRAAEACGGVIAYYPTNPTIEQMQLYAACVQRLYPGDLGVNPWIIKATVLFLLLTFVAGIDKPFTGDGLHDRALCAVFYPIMAACAILIGVLVILGVQFLIS